MTREIGEKFKIDNDLFEVVESDNTCNGCYFENLYCDANRYFTGFCSSRHRTDHNRVIFKKVE